mmetsp:Transcript_27716/g.66809  ORF Transcript_27716/g.66809 Transcript_27716/m.66809 type:complete len:219 (+) Transcript_27716:499-1155(+)
MTTHAWKFQICPVVRYQSVRTLFVRRVISQRAVTMPGLKHVPLRLSNRSQIFVRSHHRTTIVTKQTRWAGRDVPTRHASCSSVRICLDAATIRTVRPASNTPSRTVTTPAPRKGATIALKLQTERSTVPRAVTTRSASRLSVCPTVGAVLKITENLVSTSHGNSVQSLASPSKSTIPATKRHRSGVVTNRNVNGSSASIFRNAVIPTTGSLESTIRHV